MLKPTQCVVCNASLVALSKFGPPRLYCSDKCNKRSQYDRNWAKLGARVKMWREKNQYRSRHAQVIREISDRIKRENPCTDCALFYDPICMDFDHMPGCEKIMSISEMVARPAKITETILLAEIAKCELVCSNCHRLRTKGRKNG